MERIKSGIRGLDELIQGGFPASATILLSGGPGTGKTIFGFSFLYEGAKKFREPGLYITFEENLTNLIWNMESFEWDVQPLQKAGLLRIYKMNIHPHENVEMQVEEELRAITKLVQEMGCKRLVVDSVTAFGVFLQDTGRIRNLLFTFTDELKKLGCTTMLIAETRSGRTDFSSFGVEEFISDGVIVLYFTPPNRAIFIRKMRGTNHAKTVHPMDITQEGIVIKSKDEVMWESVK